MEKNFFFKSEGPKKLKEIISICGLDNSISDLDTSVDVDDVSNLSDARKKDISFLHSQKYKNIAQKTNAGFCVTLKKFGNLLPKDCIKLYVNNVLFSFAKVSKIFYPDADIDKLDTSLNYSDKISKNYNKVIFGINTLIGSNVKIGKNTVIGNNSIIEHSVEIGENCLIGSNVIIKNSILENNVFIQDGCKIGIKGFGFVPVKNKNFRLPHVGKVLLKTGVEIGSGSTIDRGSISDTIISENTFLDNQVHIAHNVKIGKNCMIAGQVGIAGSSTLGDNVVIGGQAGISGHLKIGNNVQIGGGSGVIKDVPDNSKIMGYPSIKFRDFIRKIGA